MITMLNHEFTDDEKHWYIANLYIYMHYHPINDFPINLEDVYKMIGFAREVRSECKMKCVQGPWANPRRLKCTRSVGEPPP